MVQHCSLLPDGAVVVTGRMSSWRVGDLLCKPQVTSSKGTVVLELIRALHCSCLSMDCSLPNPSTRIAGWCLPLLCSVPAVSWLFQSLGVPKWCGNKEEHHREERAEAPCFISKSNNSPLPGSAHLQTLQMQAERLLGRNSRDALLSCEHSHCNLNPGPWERLHVRGAGWISPAIPRKWGLCNHTTWCYGGSEQSWHGGVQQLLH